MSLWIYKHKLTERIISNLSSAPLSDVGIWGMGKLFGYADYEIIKFIERPR